MLNALRINPRRVSVVCLAILTVFFAFSPVTLYRAHAQAAGNTWTVNDLGDSGTTSCVANAGAATGHLRAVQFCIGHASWLSANAIYSGLLEAV